MPSYERMRDRLPSLWRPEDDDASGDQLPLEPADVLAVECEPERGARFTQRGGTVIATLDGRAKVKALRILPERALSTGCAVEVYRVAGTQPQSRPALAAVVRDGRAELPVPLELDRFAIRLRRPGLVSLLLRTASESVDRMDREAAEVMQAHWQPHADRALLSPFWHRTRALQGLVVPRPTDLIDVVQPAALAAKLKAPDTPFLDWLELQLTPRTAGLLAKYASGRVPDVLQRALVDDLDALARGALVFDPDRFEGIELDAETLEQLDLSTSPPAEESPPEEDAVLDGPPPGGLDLVLLNRRLLVQALGGMIDETLLDSPWVDDLARIGSALALPHWREPADEPESVEEYRERQRRVVALYADGLGTVAAIRRMVEAQLPIDGEQPFEQRDRAYLYEEAPALGRELLAAPTDGPPDGIVGPLMRWQANNVGPGPVPATLYIQGVEPDGDLVQATSRPAVELYAAGGEKPRLSIAWGGSLAPGETLRLQPAYSAWIGRSRGLYRAQSRPTAESAATPIPFSPWKKVTGTPPKVVMDLVQTRDRVVWGAFGEPSASLWRCTHLGWAPVVTGLAEIHCLLEDGDHLLFGCDDGIRRIPLFPADVSGFVPVKLRACADTVVYVLTRLADGRLLAGTEKGLAVIENDATAAPFLLDPSLGSETPVYALEQQADGTLYIGCSKGVFLHRPSSNETWWLANEDVSDQVPDWQPFHPGQHAAAEKNFPTEARVFLPPVLCLHRGRDESLWLGTEAGIARYAAKATRGLTYTTMVQAWPDLVTGPVHAISEDERGEVWFCTERGAFRYDGRDFWHLSGGRWSQLGRADLRYGGKPSPRPAYRYDRASEQWQSRAEHAWLPAHDPLRTGPEKPVRSVLWTDGVAADLGSWDGDTFTHTANADATLLRARYKPDEQRIVAGGIPAVPRLPAGESTWRYLALEPPGLEPPPLTPAWSVEGRLFPPPPDLPPAYPGRFDLALHGDGGTDDSYDHAVFAYPPSARVWMEWAPRRPLTVLARLKRRRAGETIDPVVLERAWQGMRQVKPAGVRALLAVDETIVRGND